MRLSTIVAPTRVLELGRRIDLPGGRDAALLIHGWTGWPGRLAYLAERLHAAGLSVHVPRLPGHGTSMQDMLATRAEDWLRRSVDEYLDLRDRYETVYLAGTSMGALIATIIAARYDVPRLALLAPAFHTRNRLLFLSPLGKLIVPRLRGAWREDQESDPRTVEMGREYSSYNYLRNAAELRRIQRAARRSLGAVRAPTLVVVSQSDRTVPEQVANFVEARCGADRIERLEVERSNHHVAHDVDRRQVADAVVAWFTGPAK